MRRPAKCFFCYSWDNKKAFKILTFLKDAVERASNNSVKVIIDRLAYKYNDNFDEKLNEIKSYDLIVPFFTPEFKSIVSTSGNEHRELKREYPIIEQCYEEDPDSVFPVILSGTMATALPEKFERKICPNIEDMNLKIPNDDDDPITIGTQKRYLLNKFTSELIGLAKWNFHKNSLEYKNEKEALEKLFHLTNTTSLPLSCLIKMDAYEDVINQRCYFVIGRKGSGKTTFLKNLSNIDKTTFDKNYKRLSTICADDLNLNHIYKVISKHSADRVEIPAKNLIILFWEVYFILQCIYIIGIEEEDNKIPEPGRAICFRNIANKLKDLLALSSSGKYLSFKMDAVPKLLSTTTIDFIDDYYSNKAIDESNVNNLIASFIGKLSTSNILDKMFGSKLLEDFVFALEECEKRIIISIDGFDKESEVFRRETEYLEKDDNEYLKRREFETEFYGQLLEVASHFKFNVYNDFVQNAVQDYLDFCILLPKDRYDQIIDLDRDSAKKQFCSLDWVEYELIDLITCRLEYIIHKRNKITWNESVSLIERFYTVLKKYAPNMPTSIFITVDGHKMEFDLFNYILRLSFWRPRDIISHFSKILSIRACEGDEKKLIENELLKLTLNRSAIDIIKNEFIKEYENVFLNLDDVLHAFDECNLIMNAKDFIAILAGTPFDTTFAYELNNIDNKLYVLYQLGVIGLYFDEVSYRKMGYGNRLCYLYNEGLEPIERFITKGDYNFSEPKIIFNTIFIEYLALNVNTKELIGNFSWEYIEQNFRLKSAIRRI